MDSKLVGKNIHSYIHRIRKTRVWIHHHIRKAWLEKQWALEQVYGNWEESDNILPKYLQALQLFVPGTIVRIQNIPTLDKSNQPIPNKVIFHQLFWSFKACIDAFAFCNLIVQIDGSWLYGIYKRTLLIAVAQDGANNIFPLAFSNVEGETTYGWHFFVKLENTCDTTTWYMLNL
ncbi:hypothetical protein GmHk_11G032685 [Glycine max]|nr:hypothetical protein GmHk_11G032685 [Glycine max]